MITETAVRTVNPFVESKRLRRHLLADVADGDHSTLDAMREWVVSQNPFGVDFATDVSSLSGASDDLVLAFVDRFYGECRGEGDVGGVAAFTV